MICDNTEFYCNHPYARANILSRGPVTHPGGSSTLPFWLIATNATAVIAASA